MKDKSEYADRTVGETDPREEGTQSVPAEEPRGKNKDVSGILKSFFKIGCIGFGGGTALIPVVEKECIADKGYMSPARFEEELVLQGLTPGAFPLKMGAGIGLEKSPLCSAGAVYATSAFGLFAVLLIMALLTVIGSGAVRQIGFLSIGISAFIIVLIYLFVAKTIKQGKEFSISATLILFCFVVLFGINSKLEAFVSLFAGKSVSIGIPELSTIDLLVLGLAVSVFTGLKFEKSYICIGKFVFSLAITVVFILSAATRPIIKAPAVKYVCYAILAVMALSPFIFEIVSSTSQNKNKIKTEETLAAAARDKKRIKNALAAAAFLTILPVLSVVVCALLPFKGNLGKFVLNSFLGTVTTFGGGTAFISTGEAMFAGTFVSPDFYWVQAVPISNALPGPLLVKMLASIGYGYAASGGAGVGTALAWGLTGALVGISTTAIVYLCVYIIFLKLKSLSFFISLKRGIMPIIAGLLVATMLSMFTNASKTGAGAGANVFAAAAIAAAFIAASALLFKKVKLKDPIVILICAAASSAIFNMIYYI